MESSDFDAMNELYAKPGHLFRRMQQIAVAIFMEECKQIDLTPVQYASLIAIQAHPGIDATRLSSTIAFDRSTLGNVLERLEAKSLIQRKARNDDRRVKLLYVTKLGTKTLSEVEPSVRAAQSRMLEGLTANDRKTLMTLMTKLVDYSNHSSRAPLRIAERNE